MGVRNKKEINGSVRNCNAQSFLIKHEEKNKKEREEMRAERKRT
jgi:hypothetical protein